MTTTDGFKKKIQVRFNIASRSYDDVAIIQKECADLLSNNVIKQWPDFYPKTILDLGTGTGNLPELLLPRFPKSLYTLNDLSSDMLARAGEKLGDADIFTCQQGDIETSMFAFHDLIVSNLALQWMNDLHATLKRFYVNSNVMAFSCLLAGTFDEWEKILQHYDIAVTSPIYPSSDELERFLLSLNPSDYAFTMREFQMTFNGAQSFMGYLKQLGASASKMTPSFSQMKRLIQICDQPFDVTYRVFFGMLKRES